MDNLDIERLEKKQKLYSKVYDLFSDVACFDDIVKDYFDLESDRMLGKKRRVLQMLVDGKAPKEIGKDYLDILEKLKIPDGCAIVIGGEVIDPAEFK